MFIFFFKQKTAYEMRISDWSSTCALPIYLDRVAEIGIARGALLAAMLLDGKDIGAVEQRLVDAGIISAHALDQFILPEHCLLMSSLARILQRENCTARPKGSNFGKADWKGASRVLKRGHGDRRFRIGR